MTDPLHEVLTAYLQNGTVPPKGLDSVLDRLVGARTGGSPADVAVLLRQLLRRASEREGQDLTLVIPVEGWPDRVQLEQAGLRILPVQRAEFVVDAPAWRPEWLPGSEKVPPDAAASKEEQRREHEAQPGDPFLQLVGLNEYRNAGQQEAIRAILTAPGGATIVVNLPTGAGKSLCAQLPALLLARPKGVSVVVVPTVALALDQEKALQEKKLIEHATAYYHDGSEKGRLRRQEIRERIASGEQGVVFTSPEALIDSLSGALFRAARSGYLKFFVVDEAHVVDQWGDEFRPAFQEIPGLRRALLREAPRPFLTLLLSATLPGKSLATLQEAFQEPGPFRVISAAQLRPEPSYWLARCQDSTEKEARVAEAVWRLPRPLILYVTRRDHAEAWRRRLENQGFSRLGFMTGDSTESERQVVIDGWREGSLDLVVATSAFGLGIDQATTRAVVHACVPETVDRYYQEVGRGGRDGRACTSVLIYDDDDRRDAQELGQIKYITQELGLKRWQQMWDSKDVLEGGRYRVPLRAAPKLGMENKKNVLWNSRTLTLMARAGLIEMDFEPPPASDEDNPQVYERFRQSRVIRVGDHGHLLAETWNLRVSPLRNRLKEETYLAHRAMLEALNGKRCFSHIFADFYSAPLPPPGNGKVQVHRSCGGCPACRTSEPMSEPYEGLVPRPPSPWRLMEDAVAIGPSLDRILGPDRRVVLHHEPFTGLGRRKRMSNLFRWAYDQGVRTFVASRDNLERVLGDIRSLPGAYAFCFTPDTFPALREARREIWAPTLYVLESPPASDSELGLARFLLAGARKAPAEIWLVPAELQDPTNRDRRLTDLLPSISFDSFVLEMNL